MLGIIITYHSFFEFLPFQIANLKKYVQVPFKIYLIDNSLTSRTLPTYPDVRYFRCSERGSPSHRHQTSVNMGLWNAWQDCDAFLIFDNDMIFLSPWTPPPCVAYHPQRRGRLEYGWLNLFYFPKMECFKTIDFATCRETGERTDSGGSIGYFLPNIKSIKIDMVEKAPSYFPEYIEQFDTLCKQYNVGNWFDIFSFNGSIIFHFRALSNWTNYPEEFQLKKKQLILTSVSQHV